MNSIAIACQKQNPNTVKIVNEKPRGPKRVGKKSTTTKQKQRTQKTEGQTAQIVRFDQLHIESNPDKALQPTASVLQPTKAVLKPTNRANQVIDVYKDNALCSTRGAVATFIIIVFILIAAGISVGITFGVIKSQGSSASQTSNSQNSLGAGSTQLPQSTISVVGGLTGSPCTSYTSINDPSRNANYRGNSKPCDDGYPFATSSGGAWIRFEGSGGTQLPTWSVGGNRCGGVLNVWTNSSLPTASNPRVNGTACADTEAQSCFYILNISIMFCTSYYVYFLPPVTICTGRYCTT